MKKYEFSIGIPKDWPSKLVLGEIHRVLSGYGIDCYTVSPEWGSWRGVLEQSARLWLIDTELKLDTDRAKQLAGKLRDELYQECVLLQVSEVEVYFV